MRSSRIGNTASKVGPLHTAFDMSRAERSAYENNTEPARLTTTIRAPYALVEELTMIPGLYKDRTGVAPFGFGSNNSIPAKELLKLAKAEYDAGMDVIIVGEEGGLGSIEIRYTKEPI